MQFSTLLTIRHSLVTFLVTGDDEAPRTIQDGGRQIRSSPHCIALNFTQISMKLQDSRYCIVTATPERKRGSNIWSQVSTCYMSKVITTFVIAAAILIYAHDYIKCWSQFNPIGSARLDCVEIGRKILVITAHAEVQTFPFFRFLFAILDLQLNGTVYKIADTTSKKFDPENMGVAAGISFLSALELEIPLGGEVNCPPPIA